MLLVWAGSSLCCGSLFCWNSGPLFCCRVLWCGPLLIVAVWSNSGAAPFSVVSWLVDAALLSAVCGSVLLHCCCEQTIDAAPLILLLGGLNVVRPLLVAAVWGDCSAAPPILLWCRVTVEQPLLIVVVVWLWVPPSLLWGTDISSSSPLLCCDCSCSPRLCCGWLQFVFKTVTYILCWAMASLKLNLCEGFLQQFFCVRVWMFETSVEGLIPCFVSLWLYLLGGKKVLSSLGHRSNLYGGSMSWTLTEHNYNWFASLCVAVTSSEVSVQGKASYLLSFQIWIVFWVLFRDI